MENKFAPLSETEFEELKEFIQTLGAYLPDNKAPYVWNTFNRLRNEKEVQPCTCSSSAGHWKRAVDFIWKWVKERE